MRFSAKRKREIVGFAIEPWPPRNEIQKIRESFSFFFFFFFFLFSPVGFILVSRSLIVAATLLRSLHAQTKEERSREIQISGVAVIKRNPRYERALAGGPCSFHRWYIISFPVCRACNWPIFHPFISSLRAALPHSSYPFSPLPFFSFFFFFSVFFLFFFVLMTGNGRRTRQKSETFARTSGKNKGETCASSFIFLTYTRVYFLQRNETKRRITFDGDPIDFLRTDSFHPRVFLFFFSFCFFVWFLDWGISF